MFRKKRLCHVIFHLPSPGLWITAQPICRVINRKRSPLRDPGCKKYKNMRDQGDKWWELIKNLHLLIFHSLHAPIFYDAPTLTSLCIPSELHGKRASFHGLEVSVIRVSALYRETRRGWGFRGGWWVQVRRRMPRQTRRSQGKIDEDPSGHGRLGCHQKAKSLCLKQSSTNIQDPSRGPMHFSLFVSFNIMSCLSLIALLMPLKKNLDGGYSISV